MCPKYGPGSNDSHPGFDGKVISLLLSGNPGVKDTKSLLGVTGPADWVMERGMIPKTDGIKNRDGR
jgi:hypothetical protein